jgi:hypothetical protein
MGDAFKQQATTLGELDLNYLFGAPFHAANKAQANMAINTATFVQQFGLDASGDVLMTTLSSAFDIPKSGVTDLSGDFLLDPKTAYLGRAGQKMFGNTASVTGNSSKWVDLSKTIGTKVTKRGVTKPYTISSTNLTEIAAMVSANQIIGYERQIGQRRYLMDESGKVIQVQGIRTISVPFITLLNVPSLTMNEVTVDFTISIRTQSTTATETVQPPEFFDQTVIDSASSGGWSNGWEYAGWASRTQTRTTGSIASTEISKSESTTTSTYTVSMKAKQKQPAGLKILLDFVTKNKDAAPKRIIAQNAIGEKVSITQSSATSALTVLAAPKVTTA